ncbi:cation diffusion facilitator family transporter [Pelotomaculum propionicicum]|uniref:cation diffusion facilitator family transporter n=1 Tax=Pelotomaculum propionicicum TaxID=258475 RepID=UPI003B7DE08A
MNDKVKAAALSIGSNTVLTVGKLAVGLSINSVSVISEAFHSGLDLAAAIIAFAAVRKSSKPADERHNYGHGKVENLSSIIEALMIVAAGVLIILNALPRLKGGGEIHGLGLGAAVMAVSAAVNILVSRKLLKVARETDSPALAADGWHLLTDVYTSLGVFVGLGLIYLTGYTIIDPIIALLVALLILKAAYDLIRDSMRSILDFGLPKGEESVILSVLKKYSGEFVEFHKLRTRKSGSDRYVDLHLVVPKDKHIETVHSLCDRIEEDMRMSLSGIHVLIHTEPCGGLCEELEGRDERNILEKCPECERRDMKDR